MQPDRLELQPLAGTRVYFSGQLASSRQSGNRRLLGDSWALCLSPIEINGRDFQQARMHVWISLPISVVNLVGDHPELQVRGFATVALYQRANGSIAYGLDQARDLEIQLTPSAGWQTLQSSSTRYPAAWPSVAAACATIPVATRNHHCEAWLRHYAAPSKHAYTKVIAYQRTRQDPHNQEFQAVIKRVQLLLSEGKLPCAEDMNVVYYLIGAWSTGQAPRHLRDAFTPRLQVS